MSRKTHFFCDRLLWVLFLGVFIIRRKLPLLVRMNSPSESDSPQSFDVFLCYNIKDKLVVQAIAQQLRNRGISYWLDKEQLIPGRHWRATQERDMLRLGAVAVFVGKHGIGKYQDLEISTFLSVNRDRGLPIIPVFLNDAPPQTTLPGFLMPFTWVDFRLTDPNPLEHLTLGITGARSNANPVLITETPQIMRAKQILTDERDQRDRNLTSLLQKMRRYVERDLNWSLKINPSLKNFVLIKLDKQLQPQQVLPLRSMNVRTGDRTPELLPAETEILEVFERPDVQGLMLILGDPGSGKTTTLLELAQVLLDKAETDPTYPIPVLLNLSSWKEDNSKQKMQGWLISELRSKYGISAELGKKWIAQQQLLLLFDGLDEIRIEHQEACMEAINQLLESEDCPTYAVVCSRHEEYALSRTRLRLNNAICLQDLSDPKLESSLVSARRDDLWRMMQADTALLELVRKPLFLITVVRTTKNSDQLNSDQLNLDQLHQATSKEARIDLLLKAYVREMLSEENDITNRQTWDWLSFLAKQLQRESETEFLIRGMSSTWVTGFINFIKVFLIELPIFLMISVLVSGLVFLLTRELTASVLTGVGVRFLSSGDQSKLVGWLSFFLLGELIFGKIARLNGFPIDILNTFLDAISIYSPSIPTALLISLLIGFFAGLSAFFLWLFIPIYLVNAIYARTRHTFRELGFFSGLISILINLLVGILIGFLTSGIVFWRITGLDVGLSTGLNIGAFIWLYSVYSEYKQLEIGGLLARLFCCLLVSGIVLSLASRMPWLSHGLQHGLLIGLLSTATTWLTYISISSLVAKLKIFIYNLTTPAPYPKPYSGFILEPYYRPSESNNPFDNGIQKLYKSVKVWEPLKSIAIIFSAIIVGTLLLHALLPQALLLMMVEKEKSGQITNVAIAIFVYAVFGAGEGISYVQHFSLRCVLFSSGSIPWNYRQFLDYSTERMLLQRVGDRYRFIHRLFQEHLARNNPDR